MLILIRISPEQLPWLIGIAAVTLVAVLALVLR